jgi:hypothetical protein
VEHASVTDYSTDLKFRVPHASGCTTRGESGCSVVFLPLVLALALAPMQGFAPEPPEQELNPDADILQAHLVAAVLLHECMYAGYKQSRAPSPSGLYSSHTGVC